VLRRLQPTAIELEGDLEVEPDPRRDQEVFRIAQEALQNALRHAEASRVVVRLHGENGRLRLEVEDDGVGFDADAPELRSRRLGLTSMEERAQRIGARLELRSTAGAGTVVRLETAHA
jgi:signal transduction histidine kinase